MDVHHQRNQCNQRNKRLFLNCNIVFPISDLLDLVLLYRNEGLKLKKNNSIKETLVSGTMNYLTAIFAATELDTN